MKRYAVMLAGLTQFLGACTVIGHQKVEGWPKLTVIEHYVPHHEMRDRCVPYTPWGSSPEACAEFDLAARTCNLYFSADFPPPEFFVKHERMHCEGYDHIGETNMRDFLHAYLTQQPRTASLAQQPRTASITQPAPQ